LGTHEAGDPPSAPMALRRSVHAVVPLPVLEGHSRLSGVASTWVAPADPVLLPRVGESGAAATTGNLRLGAVRDGRATGQLLLRRRVSPHRTGVQYTAASRHVERHVLVRLTEYVSSGYATMPVRPAPVSSNERRKYLPYPLSPKAASVRFRLHDVNGQVAP
jgi:hypothetical protein